MDDQDSIVLLLSGGLDSITLGELALYEGFHVTALTFSYGQPAQTQEILHAKRWCRKNDVEHTVRAIDLKGLGNMNKAPGEEGPRIVPARNLVMISTAANLAASIGASQVWYGATKADREYPDCSPNFVSDLSLLLEETENLRLVTPFIFEEREFIVRLAEEFGVQSGDVWSCYAPEGRADDKPCGSCNSCQQGTI